jgi:flagellar basal body-associated protein FliL
VNRKKSGIIIVIIIIVVVVVFIYLADYSFYLMFQSHIGRRVPLPLNFIASSQQELQSSRCGLGGLCNGIPLIFWYI